MDTDNEPIRGESNFPRELIDNTLVDKRGQLWRMNEKLEKRLGIFGKKSYRFDKLGVKLEEALEILLQVIASRHFDSWLDGSVRPEMLEALKSMEPVLNHCVKEGDKNFRKDFIVKLSCQGKDVLRRALTERFEEIGKAFAEERGKEHQEEKMSFSGLLPPCTRFWWQKKSARGAVYDLFCLEFSPERRTVIIDNQRLRLSFPWLCFFVCFKNGEFYSFDNHYGNHSAFWVFYRPDSVKSKQDAIFYHNLTNARENWPQYWCLGYSIPVIKLQDPLWAAKLLDYFWQTNFGNCGYHLLDFWRWAVKNIPEVSSLQAWERLSESEPDKILKLPWRECENTLGQFAEKVLNHFAGIEEEQAKILRQSEKVQEQILERFEEQLEEELVFLAGHLVIDAGLQKSSREFIAKRLGAMFDKIMGELKPYCSNIAKETAEEFNRTDFGDRSGKKEAAR